MTTNLNNYCLIILGSARPAGNYCWKNILLCGSHPSCSKVNFAMHKTRTPIPATNNTTTPTQRIPKAREKSINIVCLIVYQSNNLSMKA